MTDRSATTPHPAGIRAFVARRPVTAFLIMAFAIALIPSCHCRLLRLIG